MDVVTLALARKHTNSAIEALPKGVVYRGAVNYQNNLPAGAQIGHCYTVLYKGSSGTDPWNAEFCWGTYQGSNQWIKLGEDIKDVSVSATGTSSNDVRYITIGDTESRFASVALRAMKSAWKTGTTQAAATAILNDADVIEGDGFLATVYWTDLPGDITQAEVKAFVLKKGSSSSQKIIQFECTSGTVAPYSWFYNSYERVWRSQVPINNTLASTSTDEALSAAQGKALNDNKQDNLVSGTNIKTINGENILGEGNVGIRTYQAFPNGELEGTLAQVISAIMAFPGKGAGMAYLGSIKGACTPFGFGNVECKVEFMTDTIAVLTAYSSNTQPYMWIYNSAQSDYNWRSYQVA